MSTKAVDILQDALEMCGAYQPGEPITAADADRGFIVLNDMMALWSNQSQACFANLQQSVVLQNNKAAYTIGPGGDINGTRPLRITQAYLVDNNNNTWPVDIVTQFDWNNIGNREVTSNLPEVLFYDPQVPLGIINLFPVPVQPLYTLFWTSFLQLKQFPGLAIGVDLPEGYDGAIKANVSLKLCKYFGIKPSDDLRNEANETLATIKRTNYKPQISYYDPEITARAGNTFNVITGSWNIRGGGQ